MKKSQAWSMDIMLAVIIFIGTIFFFYTILNTTQSSKEDELKDDALKVLNELISEDSDIRVVDGSQINITKLEELLGEDYSELKSKLRIKNEFCIFFEDEDGYVIYIDATNTGIGSDIISVSDVPCG